VKSSDEEMIPVCTSLDLNQRIEVSLPKSTWLVLFELLTFSYEQWRHENPDDSSAPPMMVVADEHPHRAALWRLGGALERTMPELFDSNYDQLLTESKRLLDTAR
jgi:hypothetical protein